MAAFFFQKRSHCSFIIVIGAELQEVDVNPWPGVVPFLEESRVFLILDYLFTLNITLYLGWIPVTPCEPTLVCIHNIRSITSPWSISSFWRSPLMCFLDCGTLRCWVTTWLPIWVTTICLHGSTCPSRYRLLMVLVGGHPFLIKCWALWRTDTLVGKFPNFLV